MARARERLHKLDKVLADSAVADGGTEAVLEVLARAGSVASGGGSGGHETAGIEAAYAARYIRALEAYDAAGRTYSSAVAFLGLLETAGRGKPRRRRDADLSTAGYASPAPAPRHAPHHAAHIPPCSPSGAPRLNSFLDDVYGCVWESVDDDDGESTGSASELVVEVEALRDAAAASMDSLSLLLDEDIPRFLLSAPWASTALSPWLRAHDLFAAALLADSMEDHTLVTFFLEQHEAKLASMTSRAAEALSMPASGIHSSPILTKLLDLDSPESRARRAPVGFFVREQYSYLLYSSAHSGRMREAISAGEAYLTFNPESDEIRGNLELLATVDAEDPAFQSDVSPDRVDRLALRLLGSGTELPHDSLAANQAMLGECREATDKLHDKLADVRSGLSGCRELVDSLYERASAAARVAAGCSSPGTDASCPPFAEPQPAADEIASGLSFSRFYSEYSLARKPVVIRGGAANMTTVPWDYAHLQSACGRAMVTPKLYRAHMDTWASLSSLDSMSLGEFIEALRNGSLVEGYRAPGLPYVFDASLTYMCPAMLDEFVVPKYVANDFLQRIPYTIDVPYRSSWPSLFVGPAGSGSGLHIDSFGSSFWMGLISGRKKWILYPHDTPRSALHFSSRRGTFEASPLMYLDPTATPLMREAHAQAVVVVQEAGDLMFIPGGTPHQVVNLDDVVGISMNFVDGGNLETSLQVLKDEAACGYADSERLYHALSDAGLLTVVPREAADLPWAAFKTFPLPEAIAGGPYEIGVDGRAVAGGEWSAASLPWRAHAGEHAPRVLTIDNAVDEAEADALLAFASWPGRKQFVENDPSVAIQRTFVSRTEARVSLLHRLMHRAAQVLGLNDDEWAGGEWWIQDRAADNVLHFHADCAEGREETTLSMHPLVSTVLYLTDVGGPTVVYNASVAPSGGDYDPFRLEPASPSSGAVVWPRLGRMLAFDGRLIHGVAHDDPPSSAKRVTLLINFWRHRPNVLGPAPWTWLVESSEASELAAADGLRPGVPNETEVTSWDAFDECVVTSNDPLLAAEFLMTGGGTSGVLSMRLPSSRARAGAHGRARLVGDGLAWLEA
ncbi:JmjC domain-containing protein 4 [Thecamonas trahens ATCC 50062]|uniref:JmjC domain-containing protein 4 n=1 Tax=Thecamonas trahens ATCC 50062 TaxID=461836 RepID=A0A0L0DAS3_THETB|nr:JmjC domain-containing protein 4 [Thecamonas trahens ATCC 50062]KNC48398.1 JmjC domain-containing protein 4 [Thecamonas trahens ATCC 50062]|eukprot:XP_013758515.1 JmjC domain-containing protein 4 [Thecamonas trahens ATCC 50062]